MLFICIPLSPVLKTFPGLNMRDDFYGFVGIFRNNDSDYLEGRTIEQIMFSTLNCTCIIFLTDLELPYFSIDNAHPKLFRHSF